MKFKRSTNGISNEKSPQTMGQYYRTSRQLFKRFQKERPDSRGMSEFVDWLIGRNRSGDFAKKTWNVYRYSVATFLKDDALRERLLSEPPAGARSGERRPRTKHVSTTARERLDKDAHQRCRPAERMADRLKAWIDAGVGTGLRPIEWANASLFETAEGFDVLVVRNAKHYKDRGHGDSREIALLSKSIATAVRRHLNFIAAYLGAKPGREFRHYYESCRRGLIRLNKSLPKSASRLSLYCPRHQFKNNARAAGISPEELAYLMGHASTGTAQRHYGRPRAKGSGFGVRADGEPDNPIRQKHRAPRLSLADLSMSDSAEGLDRDADQWSLQP